MIDPYLHANNNSMYNSAFQNFMIAPGSMMGGPQGFMNQRDSGIMQSQYGGSTMGLGSSPYGYMYDNPVISKFAMESGIISRPTGTNHAATSFHQANVNSLVAGTLMTGAADTAGGLGGMYAGAAVGGTMGGIPGAIIGGIAGSMLGEGTINPITEVMDKRTMEKMAVHQSLGGLANDNSPYGGGFGFSRETSQKVYQNMENLATEDSTFTTGEMTMMFNEGISNGDISGGTVSELNKKLEKTKETIKALSEITGNNKIGEISDLIRQMVTVGFDSSAVADVTHGLSFAARRLGQNPDDYRNNAMQKAIGGENYGGPLASHELISNAFTDSLLANSEIMRTTGNKDSLKKNQNNLFGWLDRSINDRNIFGVNGGGATSEVQRAFLTDMYAREEFGKDNEDKVRERMLTGETRGTALSNIWSGVSKDEMSRYIAKGDTIFNDKMDKNGLTEITRYATANAHDLYSSTSALEVPDRTKEMMRKETERSSPLLAAYLGGDELLKRRIETAALLNSFGGQRGVEESLGQGGQSLLAELEQMIDSGQMGKQKNLQATDRRSGELANRRRNNTIGAKFTKAGSYINARIGDVQEFFSPEATSDTGQSFFQKFFYGENKKMFEVAPQTKKERHANLQVLKEGTRDGTINFDNSIGIHDTSSKRYLGNTGPALDLEKEGSPLAEKKVQDAAEHVTGNTGKGYIGSVPENRRQIGAPESLALFLSGSEATRARDNSLAKRSKNRDDLISGEIGTEKFIEKEQRMDADELSQLEFVSEKIRSGAKLEDWIGDVGSDALGLLGGVFPIDKNLQEQTRQARREKRAGVPQSNKGNIADNAIRDIELLNKNIVGETAEEVAYSGDYEKTGQADEIIYKTSKAGGKYKYINLFEGIEENKAESNQLSISVTPEERKKSQRELSYNVTEEDGTIVFESKTEKQMEEDLQSVIDDLGGEGGGLSSLDKRNNFNQLKYAGGSGKEILKAFGIERTLNKKDTEDLSDMLRAGKFTETIRTSVDINEFNGEKGRGVKSAEELGVMFADRIDAAGYSSIFADSGVGTEFDNINATYDKYKLREESALDPKVSSAVQKFSVMNADDQSNVYGAASEMSNVRMQSKDMSDFQQGIMVELSEDKIKSKFGLSDEHYNVAKGLENTEAVRKTANVGQFRSVANGSVGTGKLRDSLYQAWDIRPSNNEQLLAAQGMLGIFTHENEDGEFGMTDERIKSSIIDKEGKFIIPKNATDRAIMASFNEIAADKGITTQKGRAELAKKVTGGELADTTLDMAKLAGRDVDGLHSAVNGGAQSTESVLSVLKDILSAIRGGGGSANGVTIGDSRRKEF